MRIRHTTGTISPATGLETEPRAVTVAAARAAIVVIAGMETMSRLSLRLARRCSMRTNRHTAGISAHLTQQRILKNTSDDGALIRRRMGRIHIRPAIRWDLRGR